MISFFEGEVILFASTVVRARFPGFSLSYKSPLQSALKEHWLAVHGERIIKCEKCGATFGTAATLRRHIRNKVCEKVKISYVKMELDTESDVNMDQSMQDIPIIVDRNEDPVLKMSENEMAEILQGYREFVIEPSDDCSRNL